MQRNEILKEETTYLETILKLFRAVVAVRLGLLEIGKWMDNQGLELELAAEELEEAVKALYTAEEALNNTHKHLLVANVVGASRK